MKPSPLPLLLLLTTKLLLAAAPLTGPINHALDVEPFVFVYPTIRLSPDEARPLRADAEDAARRFGPTARVLADREASADRLAGHTVIAYGNPTINGFLARVRNQLPVQFRPDGLDLGSLHPSGEDLRVVFCCPNPESPENYLVVYGAVNVRFAENLNSLFHGPTDWVVGDRVGRLIWGDFNKTRRLGWRPDMTTLGSAERPQWGVRDGVHYRFHFVPGSLAESEIATIEATQAGAWKRDCAYLCTRQTDLPRLSGHRLDYFLYPDPESKEELTGDRGNGQANCPQWTVHAVYSAKVRCIGPHEDMHVLSCFLWAPTPTALLGEGLAEVVDGSWDGRPHAYWGRMFRAERRVPPLRRLLTFEGFRSYPDTLTYPLAGLFVRFLDERLGREGLRRLYVTTTNETLAGDLEKALGKPLAAIEEDWLASLGPAPAEPADPATTPADSSAAGLETTTGSGPASLDGVPVPPAPNHPPFKDFSLHGKSGTVLLVYGTKDEARRTAIEDLAAELTQFYSQDGGMKVEARSDSELTEADRAGHDLMLLGHLGSHRLLEQVTGRLPAATGPGGVAVAGRRYAGTDLGLAFICRDPDHPKRFWTVYTGPTYRGMMSIFRVFTGNTGFTVSQGEGVVADGEL